MPLRDHFHLPTTRVASWDELHGQWPAVIVQHLKQKLPSGFVAAPRVHLGALIEIDVATYERDSDPIGFDSSGHQEGGVATRPWVPPRPSVAVETELPDEDEYEVRIYDAERDRQLVAAIELVSPSNKDRLARRNAFVSRCAALLRAGVAVSIVDVVTHRHSNLYTELMNFIDHPDPHLSVDPPTICAASCRWIPKGERAVLETWSHRLIVGQPLPTLPLWLTETQVVPLDLERSYEQACEDLSIA